jgi:hypothetical protein
MYSAINKIKYKYNNRVKTRIGDSIHISTTIPTNLIPRNQLKPITDNFITHGSC